MELCVHEWGDPNGPPLVCLHGVMSNGHRFEKLARERLERFRVLAPDLRGHGDSVPEPPWRMETFVDDVLATVNSAGAERAQWIGHSFGGRLILELAARRPDLVERAVLLDPAIRLTPGDALERAEAERAEVSYVDIDEAVEQAVIDYPLAPRGLLADELPRFLAAGGDGRLRPRYVKSAVITALAELVVDAPAFDAIRAPMLLIVCERDSVVQAEQVDAFRAGLGERASVATVPGGHSVLREAFGATADAVEGFLDV
jgi:lipase